MRPVNIKRTADMLTDVWFREETYLGIPLDQVSQPGEELD